MVMKISCCAAFGSWFFPRLRRCFFRCPIFPHNHINFCFFFGLLQATPGGGDDARRGPEDREDGRGLRKEIHTVQPGEEEKKVFRLHYISGKMQMHFQISFFPLLLRAYIRPSDRRRRDAFMSLPLFSYTTVQVEFLLRTQPPQIQFHRTGKIKILMHICLCLLRR